MKHTNQIPRILDQKHLQNDVTDHFDFDHADKTQE